MRYLFVLWAALFFATGYPQSEAENAPGNAVTSQTFNLDQQRSHFIIKGTSSLHDWEMVSESFKGFITYQENTETLSIKDIRITVGVESLKSGKRIMDNKCHDALKYKDYPNIQYRFESIGEIKSTGSNTYSATLVGTLTIAGKSKKVPINVTINQTDKQLIIKGEKPLKMTDFDVEPPTALLGTLKTGDDITIDFNLNYL